MAASSQTPRRVFFSALVLLGALALLEGGARTWESAQPTPTRPEEQDPSLLPGNFELDPVLGWRPSPGETGDDADYEAFVQAHGLPLRKGPAISPESTRDEPLDQPRPDDQALVVVLGDSSVWGWGVAFEDSLPQQLEAALAGGVLPAAERPVEVLNAGVPGYSSYQSLLRLEQLVEAGADPDVLVVYWSNSDRQPPPHGTPDAAWFESHAFRTGATAIYELALARVLRRTLRPPAPLEDGAPARVRPTELRKNLRRLVSRAEDLGAGVVIVVPPLESDTDTPPIDWRVRDGQDLARSQVLDAFDAAGRSPDLNEYRTALSLEARAMGLPLVDAPAVIRAAARGSRGTGADVWFVDPVHPSARGHAAIAEAALPAVCQLLEVPPPGCS